jgi:hypothetical protein
MILEWEGMHLARGETPAPDKENSITQGPHVKDIAAHWIIKFLHILQDVGSICKTCNQLYA